MCVEVDLSSGPDGLWEDLSLYFMKMNVKVDFDTVEF